MNTFLSVQTRVSQSKKHWTNCYEFTVVSCILILLKFLHKLMHKFFLKGVLIILM
jgi:hypothetical protein